MPAQQVQITLASNKKKPRRSGAGSVSAEPMRQIINDHFAAASSNSFRTTPHGSITDKRRPSASQTTQPAVWLITLGPRTAAACSDVT